MISFHFSGWNYGTKPRHLKGVLPTEDSAFLIKSQSRARSNAGISKCAWLIKSITVPVYDEVKEREQEAQ